MVPKSGCDFETSQRVTTNFLKKNKKSFSSMKKTAKKISIAEEKKNKEIDHLEPESERKQEYIFSILSFRKYICTSLKGVYFFLCTLYLNTPM